ncbi:hypothetical protein ACFCXS_03320 [Streptomyces sp. NPDC056373]|uniref:hypothetical protein n=1 Tax=Streptomyces sp. NPDC056373 TaxID=3345798 RepID=UPI0035D8156B
MTRPAMRMCTRCERSTGTPAPIRQFQAPSGLPLTIYACQECVSHYPALEGAVGLLQSPYRHSRMTLHVYRVDAEGAVTEDCGKVEITAGGPAEPVPYTSAYPPCACAGCRATR